jgi:3-oxoacyl-[acyl-carrier protein] reductase
VLLLEGRNAIVYGAAGSIGSAVTRAFAREGARVHLAGRTLAKLDALAAELHAAGWSASTAEVDAMDSESVEAHATRVGRFDISFNAVAIRDVQNVPLTDMSLDDFMAPVVEAARTNFVTATTAARRMTAQGSGVIIMLSSSAAKESRHQMGGFNLACASVEALVRGLAGETGRQGVRVVGIRPNFTPETVPGITDEDVAALLKDTLTGRLPTLAELANSVAYLASDAAGAITGAVLNLTCGAIID